MHKGGFSPLFYKGVPEDGREAFSARLKARFAPLDRHLSAYKYMMGSDYSVADAHFFVVSNWASWVNCPAVVAGPKGLYRGPPLSLIDAETHSDLGLRSG